MFFPLFLFFNGRLITQLVMSETTGPIFTKFSTFVDRNARMIVWHSFWDCAIGRCYTL